MSDPKIIKEKTDAMFLKYLRNKKTMKDVIKEPFLLRNLVMDYNDFYDSLKVEDRKKTLDKFVSLNKEQRERVSMLEFFIRGNITFEEFIEGDFLDYIDFKGVAEDVLTKGIDRYKGLKEDLRSKDQYFEPLLDLGLYTEDGKLTKDGLARVTERRRDYQKELAKEGAGLSTPPPLIRQSSVPKDLSKNIETTVTPRGSVERVETRVEKKPMGGLGKGGLRRASSSPAKLGTKSQTVTETETETKTEGNSYVQNQINKIETKIQQLEGDRTLRLTETAKIQKSKEIEAAKAELKELKGLAKTLAKNLSTEQLEALKPKGIEAKPKTSKPKVTAVSVTPRGGQKVVLTPRTKAVEKTAKLPASLRKEVFGFVGPSKSGFVGEFYDIFGKITGDTDRKLTHLYIQDLIRNFKRYANDETRELVYDTITGEEGLMTYLVEVLGYRRNQINLDAVDKEYLKDYSKRYYDLTWDETNKQLNKYTTEDERGRLIPKSVDEIARIDKEEKRQKILRDMAFETPSDESGSSRSRSSSEESVSSRSRSSSDESVGSISSWSYGSGVSSSSSEDERKGGLRGRRKLNKAQQEAIDRGEGAVAQPPPPPPQEEEEEKEEIREQQQETKDKEEELNAQADTVAGSYTSIETTSQPVPPLQPSIPQQDKPRAQGQQAGEDAPPLDDLQQNAFRREGQPPRDVGTDPMAQDVGTQTESSGMDQFNKQKISTVQRTEDALPSKIDMIPKFRLSAENKSREELLGDIDYFYQTFPVELQKIIETTRDYQRFSTPKLKRLHKEIVAKLGGGKKEESKIGIVISGDDYIKQKLKEIILEGNINGLTTRDIMIKNIEGENDPSQNENDIASYEVKRATDGKASAQKEPVYKYIPETVPETPAFKPARLTLGGPKYSRLQTVAREQFLNNPFSKVQPTIKLKYSY